MTTQDLFQSMLYSFGQEPTNLRFSNDFYKSLDFAQEDFCTRRGWGFLRTTGTVTTTESTRAVDLPSDFGSILDARGVVRLTSPSTVAGNELTPITIQQFYQSYYDADEEDTPDKYWVLDDELNLTPIPDDAYTISILYYKRPDAITDAQSTITVPAVYHEALQIMLRRRLEVLGYSSVLEVKLSDEELNRLIGQFARDDIKKYGGMTANLLPNGYTVRTV